MIGPLCHPGPRAGIQGVTVWMPDQVRHDNAIFVPFSPRQNGFFNRGLHVYNVPHSGEKSTQSSKILAPDEQEMANEWFTLGTESV
jgi:hypothetical protein